MNRGRSVERASFASHGYTFLLDNGNLSSTHKFWGPYETVTARVSSVSVGAALKAFSSITGSPSPLTMRPLVRFYGSIEFRMGDLARGDFDVLAERGRRALRVHLASGVEKGLPALAAALEQALK